MLTARFALTPTTARTKRKQKCKVAKCWANTWNLSTYTYTTQGHREGGQGGTMTPGPMDFRGPTRGAMGFRRAHSNGTTKSARGAWRPFFLEITQFRPEKPLELWCFFVFFSEITQCRPEKPLEYRWRPFWSGIVFVCFGVHTTGNPLYLSWPRAHVRLSAPLTPHKPIPNYINHFLGGTFSSIMTYSACSLFFYTFFYILHISGCLKFSVNSFSFDIGTIFC